MARIVRILLGLTCAAYSAAAAHAHALPSVRIVDSDPSLSARLDTYGQLYLRPAYRGDRKISFRVAGVSDGATAEPQPSPSETSGGVDWMGDILVFGTPGYLLLQILLAWVWAGRWRAVALVPAFVVGPAILWSLFALAAGSNLWPVMALLVTPLGLSYLTAVIAARGLVAIVRA